VLHAEEFGPFAFDDLHAAVPVNEGMAILGDPGSGSADVLPGGPGHYGMIFMPGSCRRTKSDTGRIFTALEAKLARYPGDEDLANAEDWL
jgi:hypothetical protein